MIVFFYHYNINLILKVKEKIDLFKFIGVKVKLSPLLKDQIIWLLIYIYTHTYAHRRANKCGINIF